MRTWSDRSTNLAAALLALAVTVGGTALSAGASSAVIAGEREAAAQAVDRRTELVADAVRAETGRYVDTVRLLAEGIGAHHGYSRDRFDRATVGMRRAGFAGASSVAFVSPPVRTADVPRVQSLWRGRGVPTIRLDPKGAGPHMFTLFYRMLDGQTRGPNGLDVSQASAPTQALMHSLAADDVAVSPTYRLLVDRAVPVDRQQLSFVLVAPAWARNGGMSTSAQVHRGWVMMGVRGQDFVGTTLANSTQGMADVTLSARGTDGRLVRVAGLTSATPGTRDLVRTASIRVAQQEWTVTVAASSAQLPGASTGLGTVLGWGGCLVSVLVAVLVFVLATGRARAQARVVTATAASRADQTEARRQSGLLTAVLESISDAVGVVDAEGRFLVHNRAAKALLGVDDTERPVLGADTWRAHYGLFTPDGGRPFPTEDLPLVRALAGESTDGVEMLVRNAERPQGVLISVSGRPLDPTAGQTGAVAVFRDVTEERARQAELEAFAGVAAHDLRTPLAVVAGYADLVADTAVPELERLGALETARDTAQHLATIRTRAQAGADLIEDLLRYAAARQARLEIEDVDLGALARDVLAAHQERVVSGAGGGAGGGACTREMSWSVDDLPVVRGDRVRLRQVLDNLVGNAVKYAVPGEPVQIDVTNGQDPEATADGLVRIEVADRGLGIPPGQHATVFQAFRRADGQVTEARGTGLGLAICQRTVERHCGSIVAAERPDGGTRIIVTLPLAGPPVEDAEPAPGQAQAGRVPVAPPPVDRVPVGSDR